MRRAGILGTGLIGASIGHGLVGGGWEVLAWDPDEAALERAADLGAVVAVDDADALLAASIELLVLAGPPNAVIASAKGIDIDCLVMDVAGVKGPVVSGAASARFVGTHPMAGRERSGPEAASPALFRGAAWVVVTDGAVESDLLAVEEIISLLGGRPIRMSAQQHDEAVAMISHLPQVLASALLAEASQRTRAMDLAAGSFRDLTRVAASDPVSWTQLLVANGAAVASAVDDLRDRLRRISDQLSAGDSAEIEALLRRAQAQRVGLAPPVMTVQVALDDRPGELARVGRALERSSVDIRDLQMRHSPFGGGGVLTLSVRPGEAETLRAALKREDLLLAD